MSAVVDGGPAFACPSVPGSDPGSVGMSLRDYFAAQALVGLLSSPTTDPRAPVERVSDASYEIADAMLAARIK